MATEKSYPKRTSRRVQKARSVQESTKPENTVSKDETISQVESVPQLNTKKLTAELKSEKESKIKLLDTVMEYKKTIDDLKTQKENTVKEMENLAVKLEKEIQEKLSLEQKIRSIIAYFEENDYTNVKWYQFGKIWKLVKFVISVIFPGKQDN